MDEQKLAVNRRRFITGLAAAGVTSTLLPGALVAVAQDTDEVTVEMLAAAQRICGLEFSADELERIAARLNRPGGRPDVGTLRAANLGNSVQPAIVFNPVPPGMTLPAERRPMRRAEVAVAMPSSDEELAFPAGHAPGEAGRDASGQAVRAHRAVPGAAAAIRPDAALRGQLHGGDLPAAGAAGR